MVAAPVTIGCDLGQRVDYTAYAIMQTVERLLLPYPFDSEQYRVAREMERAGELQSGPKEIHHECRRLQRLPLGTPYPGVVRALVQVCNDVINATHGTMPRLYLDATGVGVPVLDLLREARCPAVIIPVFFTHGDRKVWKRDGEPPSMAHPGRPGRDFRPWVLSLGKAYLVSRLTALFETQRIHLPANHPEAQAMRDELKNYEIKADDVDNEKYGAFKVGKHDDMVTALGLGTLDDATPAGERAVSKGSAILPGVL